MPHLLKTNFGKLLQFCYSYVHVLWKGSIIANSGDMGYTSTFNETYLKSNSDEKSKLLEMKSMNT